LGAQILQKELEMARGKEELEQENAKLKRLLSELSLEKPVLKGIAAEPSCQH
jgi:hypothetical protein